MTIQTSDHNANLSNRLQETHNAVRKNLLNDIVLARLRLKGESQKVDGCGLAGPAPPPSSTFR